MTIYFTYNTFIFSVYKKFFLDFDHIRNVDTYDMAYIYLYTKCRTIGYIVQYTAYVFKIFKVYDDFFYLYIN